MGADHCGELLEDGGQLPNGLFDALDGFRPTIQVVGLHNNKSTVDER